MAWGKKKETHEQQAWLDWLNDDRPNGPVNHNLVSKPVFKESIYRGIDGLVEEPDESNDGQSKSRPLSVSQRTVPKAQQSRRVTKPKAPELNWRQKSARHTIPTKDEEADRSIAININVPEVHLPRITFRWVYMRWVLAAVIIICALLGGRLWLGHNNAISQEMKQKQTQAKPSFAPLKPAGNEDQVNKNAAYNPQKQIYTFQDSYKGVSMVVSEQAIPVAVKDNPDTIKKAAASIGATDSFDTINGTVYIATADKGGAQRLVLIHRQLLIFISSDGTLDNPTWAEYVQALN